MSEAGLPSGRGRPLSPRELDVITVAASGVTAAEGAAVLFIAENTYRNHLHTAYHKLGAGSLVEAVRLLGWLSVPADDGR